ncbi:MAG: DEAD/DEAH box helicase [Acidobacteriota bacterium]
MSLEKRCVHEVASSDRDRGRQYFSQRRVKIDASDDYGLNATVRGAGRTYEVQIDWFDSETSGILTASCQCPRYRAGRLCKHIWATLLTADQRGVGKRIAGDGELQVFLESSDGLPHTTVEQSNGSAVHAAVVTADAPPSWRKQFQTLRRVLGEANGNARQGGDPRRMAHYRINVLKSLNSEQLVIDLFQRTGREESAALRPLELDEREASRFLDPDDHELLSVLLATAPPREQSLAALTIGGENGAKGAGGAVPPVLYDTLLPRLCATGRFGWINGLDEGEITHHPLEWDDDGPWAFLLKIERLEHEEGLHARVAGCLRRDGEERELSEPLMLLPEGVVIFRDRIAPFDPGDHFAWAAALRRDSEIDVPETEVDAMLEDLWSMPVLPPMELPVQWQLDEVRTPPITRVTFRNTGQTPFAFKASLRFDYDGLLVEPGKAADKGTIDRIVDRPHGRLVFRDAEIERQRVEELELLLADARGERMNGRNHDDSDRHRVSMVAFPEVARHLIDAGWEVEAEGQRVRRPSHSEIALSVSSNVDWFELEGEIDFGVTTASLPSLLEAIRRGDLFVRLDDGTHGLLPEEWIQRFSSLAANTVEQAEDEIGEAVRFLPSQALLLDTLIGDQEVDVDRDFERVRKQLQDFDKVEEAKEPRGFQGTLRTYQREGLGWLKFLKEHGFGGCLADDMGLGKTVQVLALLQLRRARKKPAWERLPSLIVVPRSLVHNWIEEGARFTPKLQLVNYTGPGRHELLPELDEADVIVTTYGTLRRDVDELTSMEFDYAILDEAQAIKNASSQAAKACRRLRAHHRLALTGTPVENHLGELWSIFEFLNPGMLSQKVLKDVVGAPADSEAVLAISAALKPFIFRRTKAEVLKDLPEKTEQTLYCELEGEQARLYQELRDHYRAALEERIEQVGLRKSKIQVLEALLRLRQAACHPGLIDEERRSESSGKLHTVLQHLEEVLDEGHKALVFSQFTSLLGIVREHLDRDGVTYEYLDGRTRKREERVQRFQEDPDCRLFLISLKAGGVGLNLTAADYVFILDPWWNPAVEAQAVDRAHRIGQTRPVFAYRLISRGTVEEKIMELQGSKKQLADAILSADKSLIGDLSTDDLQILLS